MSDAGTILEIDTDAEIQAMIRKLNSLPKKIAAPEVLKDALNDTARQVRGLMNRRAKKRYALSDARVLTDKSLGAAQMHPASATDPSAGILSMGPMLDLMKFMTTPNSGTASAAAKVINEHSMKGLEMGGLKAFVTRFASGHMAIAQRNPPKEYTGTGAQRRLADHAKNGGTWNPDMTQIKKLLGPAVPHMLGTALGMSQGEIERTVYEKLQAHIQRRVDKANES